MHRVQKPPRAFLRCITAADHDYRRRAMYKNIIYDDGDATSDNTERRVYRIDSYFLSLFFFLQNSELASQNNKDAEDDEKSPLTSSEVFLAKS